MPLVSLLTKAKAKSLLTLFLAKVSVELVHVGEVHNTFLTCGQVHGVGSLWLAGKSFSHLYFYSFVYSFIHKYLINVFQVLGIVLIDRDNKE